MQAEIKINTEELTEGEKKNKEEVPEENIKELLFSNGGGAVTFMAGYIHGMVAIIGKEKLREYKLGGVSAGSSMSFFLHLVLNQDEYDMKYFYQEWHRKLFEKENRKYFGFLTSSTPIRNFQAFYSKLREEKNLKTMNDNVHVAITTFNRFGFPKKEIISEYEDDTDLCDSIIASCNIPFLLDPQIFANFRGRKALDGGFMTMIPYRFENSKKVFINILPKVTCGFPFVWKKPNNLEIIHAHDSFKTLYFPKDFWLWDEVWADEMFENGVIAAQNDSEKLLKIFS